MPYSLHQMLCHEFSYSLQLLQGPIQIISTFPLKNIIAFQDIFSNIGMGLTKNKIISQAGSEGGERIKKNGIVGMMGDDDFWNLETECLWLSSLRDASANRSLRVSFNRASENIFLPPCPRLSA